VLLPEKDFADFQRPRAEYRAVAGASPGMDQRLQDRLPDAGQLRVCRLADPRRITSGMSLIAREKKLEWDPVKLRATNGAGKRIVHPP